MDVLHVVERGMAVFEAARTTVDVVCAGDSLTGCTGAVSAVLEAVHSSAGGRPP